jgi:hypothetical protein
MQLNRFLQRKTTTRFTDTAPGPRVTPTKYVGTASHNLIVAIATGNTAARYTYYPQDTDIADETLLCSQVYYVRNTYNVA